MIVGGCRTATPAAPSEAVSTTTVKTASTPAATLLTRMGHVSVPGLDEDVLVLREVEHVHHAALDVDERRRAGVLREPDRAAHGCRGVLALRPVLALSRAPEAALLLLRRPVRRLPRLRAGKRLGERQNRDRLLGLLLREDEPALVEVGGLLLLAAG